MVNINTLLEQYKIKANPNMLLEMWNESHRSYHSLKHLYDLFSLIEADYYSNKFDKKTYENLLLTAIFHDIIYVPTANDNEEKSADFFHSLCVEKNSTDILNIKQAILDTKTHEGNNPLSVIFNKYDMNIVERDIDSLLEWERGIREEYSSYSDEDYKFGRTKFLEGLLNKYPLNSDNLQKLINLVNNS